MFSHTIEDDDYDDLNSLQQLVTNTSEGTEVANILFNAVYQNGLQDEYHQTRQGLEPKRTRALSADQPIDRHQGKGVGGEFWESSGVIELHAPTHSAEEAYRKVNETDLVVKQRQAISDARVY